MSQAGPLRVLVVGPTPPPFHGVATFVRDLIASGLGPGVELDHVDTSDRRDTANLGRWDFENLALGFRNVAEIAGRCSRFRPHLLHLPLSQNLPAFMRDALFILQARACGAKVVAHLHGGWFRSFYETAPAPTRAWIRFVLRRTAVMIVLGEGFRPLFDGLLPKEHVHVVPNGVPDSGAWALREERGPRETLADGGTVAYLGTLLKTKGLPTLFEAVAALRRKRPQLKLRLAGAWYDEQTRREMEELLRRLELGERVEFVGTVDGRRKAEFLAAADLFCLPTRYPLEGQPLVLLEALAAGLPIVSTRHAVIPETVPEGEAGLLLSKEAAGVETAAAWDELLSDPQKRREMGRAGRARYLRLYTPAACRAALRRVMFAAARA